MSNTQIMEVPTVTALSTVVVNARKESSTHAENAVNENCFVIGLQHKSLNTRKTYQQLLKTFVEYLQANRGEGYQDLTPNELGYNPYAWEGITKQEILVYKQFLLQNDYSIASINLTLCAIRAHINCILDSTIFDEDSPTYHELSAILTISTIPKKAAARIDFERKKNRKDRAKYETPYELSPEEFSRLLFEQPQTEGGLFRALLIALLGIEGLRIQEACTLKIENCKNGKLQFIRSKNQYPANFTMHPETQRILDAYLRIHPNPAAKSYLFVGLTRDDRITDRGKWSEKGSNIHTMRRIVQRHAVKILGIKLSPHMLRHFAGNTLALAESTPWGMCGQMGWKSLSTAEHYLSKAKISNHGAHRPESYRVHETTNQWDTSVSKLFNR